MKLKKTIMQKPKIEMLYVCKPFRGKCKSFVHPSHECEHAIPHKLQEESFRDDCSNRRDGICGGKCFPIKKTSK